MNLDISIYFEGAPSRPPHCARTAHSARTSSLSRLLLSFLQASTQAGCSAARSRQGCPDRHAVTVLQPRSQRDLFYRRL